MISAADVSAVLVTRGDVDLSPILASLPFADVVVWDNSKRQDLGVFGRYAAIAEAKHDVIYTQDDDVLVSCIPELLAAYEPGVLTINHPPEFPLDIPWLGKGAIFDRDLWCPAMWRYLRVYPGDRFFTHCAADGPFGLLTPLKVIHGAHESLPQAYRDDRISTTPGWYEERRPLILERCRALGSTW